MTHSMSILRFKMLDCLMCYVSYALLRRGSAHGSVARWFGSKCPIKDVEIGQV